MSKERGPRRVIAVLIERVTPAAELIRVAQAMRDDDRLAPVVILARADLESQLPRGTLNGLRILSLDRNSNSLMSSAEESSKMDGGEPTDVRSPAGWSAHVPSWVKASAAYEALSFMRGLRARYRVAKRVLDELAPAGLLIADDRSLWLAPAFIRAASERRCLTMVIPFALSNPESDAHLRHLRSLPVSLDAVRSVSLRRLVAGLFPRQVRSTGHGRMLFFPAQTTLVLAAMRMLPPMPWCLGGGRADLVAVFGPRDARKAAELGVSSEKIIVSGQPSTDHLRNAASSSKELRDQIDAGYNLDSSRLLVVCAVPHFGEHTMTGWDTHWKDIEWLIGTLSQCKANVLLSLHPKSKAAQYQDRIEPGSLQLSRDSLTRMLPAADIFVATYSSTVRWSILLGIPTVVMDHYKLNYSFYDDVEGLAITKSREELESLLGRLIEDSRFREVCRLQLLQGAPQWGSLRSSANDLIIDALLGRLAADN